MKIDFGRFENRAHLFPVHVFYNHTDAGGIVYYANYFRMAEEARVAMFKLFGRPADQTGEFVVRRANAEYLKPARYDDDLVIKTRLTSLRGTSMELSQTIIRGAEAIVEMTFTLAFVDLKAMKPARIPEFYIEKLKGINHDE